MTTPEIQASQGQSRRGALGLPAAYRAAIRRGGTFIGDGPFEDSIHPYPLAFDPPLIEHAVGENNGFAHHWEMLNYVFALPNPAEFPELTTLTDDDRAALRRYVKVCRQLAGYSALNNDSGLNVGVRCVPRRCRRVRAVDGVGPRHQWALPGAQMPHMKVPLSTKKFLARLDL
jgi:hypothetical protein